MAGEGAGTEGRPVATRRQVLKTLTAMDWCSRCGDGPAWRPPRFLTSGPWKAPHGTRNVPGDGIMQTRGGAVCEFCRWWLTKGQFETG